MPGSTPPGAPGSYPIAGTLAIAPDAASRLRDASRAGLPNEACGLLGGIDGVLTGVYPLANSAASPVRYEIDPLEQLEAYNTLAEDGLEVLGAFHSHPETPARPSAEDIAEAYDSESVYVIVSLATSAPVIRAFRIAGGTVSELHLVETQSVAGSGDGSKKGSST